MILNQNHNLIGLSKKALDYLKNNVRTSKMPGPICENCGKVASHFNVQQKTVYDFFQPSQSLIKYPLHEYHLLNQKIVKEVIQEQPWSRTVQITFLCLESNGKKMFEWIDGQIENLL